jgi:uncharacterized protein with von Willebrand factor type A (vWA) domain
VREPVPGALPPVAAALAVALAAQLRARGVAVPMRSAIGAAEALRAVGAEVPSVWYAAARATLVTRRDDHRPFDEAWRAVFGTARAEDRAAAQAPRRDDRGGLPSVAGDADGPRRRVRASPEVLDARRDFAAYSAEEHRAARRVMRRLAADAPRRPGRRYRPAPSGRRLDLGRTLRAATGTDGELLRRRWHRRRLRPRRLVLLLDVSGSMADYERALLGLAHAAVAARGGPGRPGVEVFTVATACTRITRELAGHDADRALAAVAARAVDAAGGTRLGACLRAFNDTWGLRGLARGADVVICSDGWDAGDPALLDEQMARLRRVAHRVVWVNPLAATPGYAPLAGGMAAALGHLDAFLPGHTLEAVGELFAILAADPDRHRWGRAR